MRSRQILYFVPLLSVVVFVFSPHSFDIAWDHTSGGSPLHVEKYTKGNDYATVLATSKQTTLATVQGRRTKAPSRGDNMPPKDPQAELPYVYPVHRHLPSSSTLREGLHAQLSKSARECFNISAGALPIIPVPVSIQQGRSPGGTPPSRHAPSLMKEFQFDSTDALRRDGYFLDEATVSRESIRRLEDVWWIPKDGGNVPCTAEAQRALQRHQNPPTCRDSLYMVTKLKQGAHGLGAALSIVVYDFLSAIMTDRVLVLEQGAWFFASGSCSDLGWKCYFGPPTACSVGSGSVATIDSLAEAKSRHHKIVRKKALDVSGLGRSDVPTLQQFLKEDFATCTGLEEWLHSPQNYYMMGTFQRGADPYLTWLMAQVLRYVMRLPQPWFVEMLRQNLPRVGITKWPQEGGGVVFVQLRGEVAKYREYYSVIGCHDVHISAYVNFTAHLAGGNSNGALPAVFISGNTPHQKYEHLRSLFRYVRNTDGSAIHTYSTWNHSAMSAPSGVKETQRWGADSLLASWLDFYAGIAATGWVCIIQSNWCRMINFLRLTAGRAQCPMIDLGVVMVADSADRNRYCVTRPEWPTKPFSGLLERRTRK